MKDDMKKGTAGRKIKALQKNYNKILIDLFEEYAGECIENALNGAQGAFGENIQSIVRSATDELAGKVLSDLGAESETEVEVVDLDMGGYDNEGDVDVGPGIELSLGEEDDEVDDTKEDEEED